MDASHKLPVTALAAVALWAAIGLLPAASAAVDPAEAPPVLTNTICPVMEDEPVDPEIFVEYEGRRVYLCCDRCLRRFEANPDRYAEALARVMPVAGPTAHAQGEHAHSPDDEHEHGEHDHAAHEHGEAVNPLLKFIYWLGRFHPPAVAFPIGLLIAAGVAEVLFMMTGKPRFNHAADFCVWFGIIMTVVAGILGWFFAGFRLVDDDWLLTTHRWIGTTAVLWSILLGWLALRADAGDQAKWRQWYRVALLVAVILVATNAYFGGAMIYGLEHYVW